MKIVCIGRNYADHIKELNNPVPSAPVFFLKPDTALVTRNRPFHLPPFSANLHYEAELVMKIGKTGKNIPRHSAAGYIAGIGIGLDFTARDLQDEAKAKGLPWTLAKGFDQSAPVSRFLPRDRFPDLKNIGFRLDLNGKRVQDGNSGMMIHDMEKIIENISVFMTLRKGDLIFTGTPAGVGRVSPGDLLEAWIGEEKLLKCRVIRP